MTSDLYYTKYACYQVTFILKDIKRTEEPKIYEWLFLPFDNTCRPCCAVYALHWHIRDTSAILFIVLERRSI